jgi:hypothetical protein
MARKQWGLWYTSSNFKTIWCFACIKFFKGVVSLAGELVYTNEARVCCNCKKEQK